MEPEVRTASMLPLRQRRASTVLQVSTATDPMGRFVRLLPSKVGRALRAQPAPTALRASRAVMHATRTFPSTRLGTDSFSSRRPRETADRVEMESRADKVETAVVEAQRRVCARRRVEAEVATEA